MGTMLRLSEIPTDRPLRESLYDAEGLVVVTSGTKVTRAQLEQFAERGLKFLELGEPVPLDRASSPTEQSPAKATAGTTAGGTGRRPAPANRPSLTTEQTGDNAATQCDQNKPKPYNAEMARRVERLVNRASGFVSNLGIALVKGTLRDVSPIHEVAAEFLYELRGDCDQVVAAAIFNPIDQELSVRSVQMSILSMAICRAMKLPESEWLSAGSAAMLHDMALFHLPECDRYPHAGMQLESRKIYETHPAIAYDSLEKVTNVDGTVRITVLQVHEQSDGSGFPAGITAPRIHRLARILNVADAYLRLVSCGFGGHRIFPADAMAYLMHHSCDGRFDPAVTCGLIKAISLYPLGSLVQLNNYTSARVIRCNPESPLKPVVVPAGEEQVVDLSTANNLCVGDVVDDPEFDRRRLTVGEFDRIFW